MLDAKAEITRLQIVDDKEVQYQVRCTKEQAPAAARRFKESDLALERAKRAKERIQFPA